MHNHFLHYKSTWMHKDISELFIVSPFSEKACIERLTLKVMPCYFSSFFKGIWNMKELWNMHDLQWMTYSKSATGLLSLSPNVAVIATSTRVPFGSKCNEVSTHGVAWDVLWQILSAQRPSQKWISAKIYSKLSCTRLFIIASDSVSRTSLTFFSFTSFLTQCFY